MSRAVAVRVDDLGDDPGGRDLEGVVGAISRHVGVARRVHGDARGTIKTIARAVAGKVDDLGDDDLRRCPAGPHGGDDQDGGEREKDAVFLVWLVSAHG